MYYLFIIKKEIYEIYKTKKYSLYKLIYNLYHINKSDILYGITLYNQICETINTKKLNKYLEMLNIKKEEIKIKPSHIIYKEKNINPDILYIISNYSKYIFICNFKEKEFFFLEEKL